MRDSKLDEIDVKLLMLLQEDGRMSQHDLAEAIDLSSPSTGERIRKLVDRGVIRHFAAILEPKKVGKDVTAFVSIDVDGSQNYPEVLERALATPEILECHAITGAGSHILKIRTTSTSTLERLLATIQSWPGVHSTRTSVVLSVTKETSALLLNDSASEAADP